MTILTGRRAVLAGAGAAAIAAAARAEPQTSLGEPFRIGEISSYAALPGIGIPYRMGWEMMLAQVNNLGGINGRRVEFVSRDDGGDPAAAAQMAAQLVEGEKVDLLAGGFLSECASAISAYALRTQKPYIVGVAAATGLTWEDGNRFTYRIAPNTFEMSAMLVESAIALPARKWATIAPDNLYGRSAVSWFRKQLSGKLHDAQFVGEQWVGRGGIDAPSAVGNLSGWSPDAVFCAVIGPDLVRFVQEGNGRGLFANRTVAAMAAGDPEWLAPLRGDTPPGWIVTGYPAGGSDEPWNKQFVVDYNNRYNTPPGMGSVIGAAMVNAIVSGVLRATGTDGLALADGFSDATFTTPFGICRMRPSDHQSTLGAYTGRLVRLGDAGAVTDWRYVGGDAVLPPPEVVRQLRQG